MQENSRNRFVPYFNKHGVDGIFKVIVDHDVMCHQAMISNINQHIQAMNLVQPLEMIDLGCGAAFHIAESFQGIESFSYTGVDTSSASLEAAKHNVSVMPNLSEGNFLEADFLETMEKLVSKGIHYDLALSSYAQHHLKTKDKERFFNLVQSLLNEGDHFLLVDMVNQVGSREAWLQTMEQWIIDLEIFPSKMVEESMEHIEEFDFPETVETLQQLGKSAGFRKSEVCYTLPEKEQFYTFIKFQK